MRVISSSAGPRCRPETPGHPEGRHSFRAPRALSLLVALAALAFTALVGSASAAVTGTHVIAVLPDSSGLELSAYPKNTTVNVRLLRNGAPVSTGTSKIDVNGDGVINGGTTDCWTGVTPDILPGDTVEVSSGTAFTDTMTVQDTGAGTPTLNPVNGDVLVQGHASGPNGAALPPGTVETRLINTGFTDGRANANGRQLRAGPGNPFGISFGTFPAFTATYDGLDAANRDLALNATDIRAIFRNVALNEVTISSTAGVRGPVAPCTAPFVRTAITSSTPSAINKAFVTARSPVTISGVAANDVTAVSVTVPKGVAHVGTPAGGAWSAQIPASEIAALPDGNVTVTATFTSANPATPASSTFTIPKDTVAPPAPVAAPGSGTYTAAQSVRLEDGDQGATVHYTTTGATPTAASASSLPIAVTSSQTLKAVAIDPAGNASPLASFAYTIAQPASAAPPRGLGVAVDRIAPRLRLRLPGGGALLTRNRIAITLNADENALVTIRGTVGIRSGGRSFRLKVLHKRLTKGHASKVRLQVPPSALPVVRRALARHRAVTVHLTIKAVDAAGNGRTIARSFRLSG